MTTPTTRFKPEYYAKLNQAVYKEDSQAAIRQFSKAKVLDQANIWGWKIILVQHENEKCAVIRGSDNVGNWLWNTIFAADQSSHTQHRALIQLFNTKMEAWEQTHGKISVITGHSAGGYFATHTLKDRQLTRITFNTLLPVRSHQTVNFRTSGDPLSGVTGAGNCIDLGEGSHSIDDVVMQSKGLSWPQPKKGPWTHSLLAVTNTTAHVASQAVTSYLSHPEAIGRQLYRQAQHQQKLSLTRLEPSLPPSRGLTFTPFAPYQEEILFLSERLQQLYPLRVAALQTQGEVQKLAHATTSHAMKTIKSKGKKVDRTSNFQTGLSFVEKVFPAFSPVTSIISRWFGKKGAKEQKKISKLVQRLESDQQAFLLAKERADRQTAHVHQTIHSILTRITTLSFAILGDSESTTAERQAALQYLIAQRKRDLAYNPPPSPPHPTHKKTRVLQHKQHSIDTALHDQEEHIRRHTAQTELTSLESKLTTEQKEGPQRDYNHRIDKARKSAAPQQETAAALYLALRIFFESLGTTGCLNVELAKRGIRAVDGSYNLFQVFAIASDLFTQIKTAHLTPGAKVSTLEACTSLLTALSLAVQGLSDLTQANAHGIVTTQDLSLQLAATEERLKEELATLYAHLYTTKQALEQEIHTSQEVVLARFSKHEHQQTVTRLKDKIVSLEEVKIQWNPLSNIDDYILRLLGFCRTISYDSNNGYINSTESWTPTAELRHLHDHPELFTGLLGKFDGQILPSAAIYEQLLEILEMITNDLQGNTLPLSTKKLLKQLCTTLDTISQALRYFENNIQQRLETLCKSAEKYKQTSPLSLPTGTLVITGDRKFFLYTQLTQKPASTVLTPSVVSKALYTRFTLWRTPTEKATEQRIQTTPLRDLLENQKENTLSPIPVYIGVDLKQKTLKIVSSKEQGLLACHFVQGKLFVYTLTQKLQHLPKTDPDYTKTVSELITNYHRFLRGKSPTPFDALKDSSTIVPSTSPNGIPLAFPNTLLAAIKAHLKTASFWLSSSQIRYSFSPQKGTLTILAPTGQEVTIATFDPTTISAFRPDPLSPHIVEEEFLIQALYSSYATSPLGLPGPNSISIEQGKEIICIAPAEVPFEGLYKLWQQDPHQAIHYKSTPTREPLTSSPTPPKPTKLFADLDDTCNQNFYLTLAWLKLLSHLTEHTFQSDCDDLFSPTSWRQIPTTGGFLPTLHPKHAPILQKARALLS